MPKTKPFPVRLTERERTTLERKAGKRPLGSYIRACLLNGEDRQTYLAQALALLGKSELAKSLRTLSEAARIGALPVTQETEDAIKRACQHVADIKSMLMRALRIKED